jgi:cobyrinic acid a,c-diamide synthase
VTLALLAALKRRGINVKAGKIGPDYIDPAFHAAATGQEGFNIDTWVMPVSMVSQMLETAGSDADLMILEGAMGLFDGVPSQEGIAGSAADVAARFGIPVLLVADVSGQSQSAAALVHGFAHLDPHVRISGVVINKVGSARHRLLVEDAVARTGIPVVGAVMRNDKLVLPERHLGLVQAREHAGLDALLNALADMAENTLDLEAIVRCAAAPDLRSWIPTLTLPFPREGDSVEPAATVFPPLGKGRVRVGIHDENELKKGRNKKGAYNTLLRRGVSHHKILPPPGQRIALARDDAFNFIYAHILAQWRQQGAEIHMFSPLNDEAPPEDCDACWLPGGYPELHAAKIAQASLFLNGLRRFSQARGVHGECGGYMVLGEYLEDASGTRHAMAGLLSHATSFAKRKLHLGYRQAVLARNCVLGKAGDSVRGHEFHYAAVSDEGTDTPLITLKDAQGNDLGGAGGMRGHVSGTFFHVMAVGG